MTETQVVRTKVEPELLECRDPRADLDAILAAPVLTEADGQDATAIFAFAWLDCFRKLGRVREIVAREGPIPGPGPPVAKP